MRFYVTGTKPLVECVKNPLSIGTEKEKVIDPSHNGADSAESVGSTEWA